MVSFDIASLFPSIPTDETINVCIELLDKYAEDQYSSSVTHNEIRVLFI